jgi:hypothetical protein
MQRVTTRAARFGERNPNNAEAKRITKKMHETTKAAVP